MPDFQWKIAWSCQLFLKADILHVKKKMRTIDKQRNHSFGKKTVKKEQVVKSDAINLTCIILTEILGRGKF